MEDIKTAIITCSFLLSVLALLFTRRSWLESNRPIATAEIRTDTSCESHILYNLVVYNIGSRPAVNIQLLANPKHIENVIKKESSENLKNEIRQCFNKESRIPLLHHGEKTSNGFAATSIEQNLDVLHYNAIIPIDIQYRDLYGKSYNSKLELIVKNSNYFAHSGWGQKESG